MSEFTSAIIDVGIVVRDVDRAVAFYRDAIGFEETSSFSVPASVGRDTGLSDGQPFRVRVMRLAGTEGGSRIKLIEFADAPSSHTAFIQSATGVRYLTVRVADIDAACGRAIQAGVPPIADAPVQFKANVWVSVVRDPDGNMIELVGPRR